MIQENVWSAFTAFLLGGQHLAPHWLSEKVRRSPIRPHDVWMRHSAWLTEARVMDRGPRHWSNISFPRTKVEINTLSLLQIGLLVLKKKENHFILAKLDFTESDFVTMLFLGGWGNKKCACANNRCFNACQVIKCLFFARTDSIGDKLAASIRFELLSHLNQNQTVFFLLSFVVFFACNRKSVVLLTFKWLLSFFQAALILYKIPQVFLIASASQQCQEGPDDWLLTRHSNLLQSPKKIASLDSPPTSQNPLTWSSNCPSRKVMPAWEVRETFTPSKSQAVSSPEHKPKLIGNHARAPQSSRFFYSQVLKSDAVTSGTIFSLCAIKCFPFCGCSLYGSCELAFLFFYYFWFAESFRIAEFVRVVFVRLRQLTLLGRSGRRLAGLSVHPSLSFPGLSFFLFVCFSLPARWRKRLPRVASYFRRFMVGRLQPPAASWDCALIRGEREKKNDSPESAVYKFV